MRKTAEIFGSIFCGVLCLLICSPVLLLMTLSVQDETELLKAFSPLDGGGFSRPDLLPLYPAIDNYKEILLYSPDFYTVFWNSLGMTAAVLGGQLLIGVPAAWAFAKFKFRFKKLLFDIYVLLMLLPFQVTMLSQYILLDKTGLMDSRAAIILPAVFSAFPVFIMYRSFCAIPKEILDSARIDGAGEWRILFRIGLPMGSGGITAAAVLGFLDFWNMVEQPLTFLKDKRLFPLSLYLPMLEKLSGGMLAASAVTLIPAVFVFVMGQDRLESGIISSAVKE